MYKRQVFRVYPEAQLHFYLDFMISLSIQLDVYKRQDDNTDGTYSVHEFIDKRCRIILPERER